jgi:hypothetical protein
MNKETKNLCKLIDIFEDAGFTVTHLYMNRGGFHAAIKSNEVQDPEAEFSRDCIRLGEAAGLLNKNGFKVYESVSNWEITNHYLGTMFFKLEAEEDG